MLAERDAHLRALAHELERPLGHADGAHAVVDAARAEPGLRDREAAALLAEEVLRRDAHVLEQRLAVATAVRRAPNTGSERTIVTPGVSSGITITMLWRRCASASGSETPMRMANVQRADAAPLVHHLCALTT